MPSQNDITGDMIQSKGTSAQYRDNWDKIFGKKKKIVTKYQMTPINDEPRPGICKIGIHSYKSTGATDSLIVPFDVEMCKRCGMTRKMAITGDYLYYGRNKMTTVEVEE